MIQSAETSDRDGKPDTTTSVKKPRQQEARATPAKPLKHQSSAMQRRWRHANPDQRRELIIDVAMAMLDADGPHAVTMRRVAHRLGVGAMTLYTYIEGQDHLRTEMIRRGIELLRAGCTYDEQPDAPHDWRRGARHYLQFAFDNPKLYDLMFSVPIDPATYHRKLGGEFEPLRQRVRKQLQNAGLEGDALEAATRQAAGRYWISLHGLASLAIAGRLDAVGTDLDGILDDLLAHVSPEHVAGGKEQ